MPKFTCWMPLGPRNGPLFASSSLVPVQFSVTSIQLKVQNLSRIKDTDECVLSRFLKMWATCYFVIALSDEKIIRNLKNIWWHVIDVYSFDVTVPDIIYNQLDSWTIREGWLNTKMSSSLWGVFSVDVVPSCTCHGLELLLEPRYLRKGLRKL